MPGSTTVGQNSGGSVCPHSRISHDGNSRVEPSRNIMYQSGCEPEDTCAGLYGPNSQTGLIWARPPSAAQYGEHDEEEAAGLGRVDREDPLAADGVLGAARRGELGVLLPHDEGQVRADQGGQDRRDQQHVDDVEPCR